MTKTHSIIKGMRRGSAGTCQILIVFALLGLMVLQGACAEEIQVPKGDAEFEVQFARGQALEKQGDLDGAIVAYRKAIQLDGKVAKYHFKLGKALESQGSLDDAIVSYRKAVRLRPEFEHYRAALTEAVVLRELVSSNK